MALHESVRRVLELAERCTMDVDISHELKEAVRYCIASELAWIQPVFAVAYEPPPVPGSRPSLFWDRPIILPPPEEYAHRSPKRLLLKAKGEAALAEVRMSDNAHQGPKRDVAEISLKRLDEQLLVYLLKRLPNTVKQAEAEAEPGIYGARKAIGQSLACLRKAGLVYRPNGPRGGDTLTEPGKKLAQNLAAPPAKEPLKTR